MSRVLIVLLRIYRRYLSPLKPPVCRFRPTCSQYAIDALRLHGLWRGGLLALWRILRCHPFGGHGFDPVPGMPPPRLDDDEAWEPAVTPLTDPDRDR